MQLPNFIKRIFCKIINREIHDFDDIAIVRCVIEPYHFDKKLKPHAFIPSRGSNDLSLIRLRYCNESAAKADGVKLAESKKERDSNPGKIRFNGLAVLNNKIVSINNERVTAISAQLKCSPLDKESNLIDDSVTVFKCDDGKPYHADLIYSQAVPDGEPATDHRKYADNLKDQINTLQVYYEDTCKDQSTWCGGNIVAKLKSIFQ